MKHTLASLRQKEWQQERRRAIDTTAAHAKGALHRSLPKYFTASEPISKVGQLVPRQGSDSAPATDRLSFGGRLHVPTSEPLQIRDHQHSGLQEFTATDARVQVDSISQKVELGGDVVTRQQQARLVALEESLSILQDRLHGHACKQTSTHAGTPEHLKSGIYQSSIHSDVDTLSCLSLSTNSTRSGRHFSRERSEHSTALCSELSCLSLSPDAETVQDGAYARSLSEESFTDD
eukprot:SAG11_NODE_1405_length_5002_cov_4.030797_4_plen_234_part_00